MKKQYFKPEIKTRKVNPSRIICTSNQDLVSGGEGGGIPAESKLEGDVFPELDAFDSGVYLEE